MPSFGEQLRQARESQNITLQEIAATTKISSRALQALESEQFDQLPGGIFNKGFVRAYARYVGLDEEKMLAAYMAVAKNEAPETDIQAVSSQIAATRKPAQESRIGGTTLMSVLAVIVGLALGGVWFREHRREVREQAALQAAQQPPPVATAPQPAPVLPQAPQAAPDAAASNAGAPAAAAPATTGETAPPTTSAGTATNSKPAPSATSPSTPPGNLLPGTPNKAAKPVANPPQNVTPNAAPNVTPNVTPAPAANVAVAKPETAKDAASSAGQPAPVEVSFTATQKAWISVSSDGKKLESLTLDPDNPQLRSRSYKANEKLKVVVGNAGGVTAVCNGKSSGPLGSDGQAKTITFTAQGMARR